MTRPVLPALLAALAVVLVGCGGGATPETAPPEAQESVVPVDDDEPSEDPEDSPEPSPEPSEEATEEAAPTFEEACAGREDEAFIEVLTPQPGATVTDPFTVTGCGNTFEANYLYRLETEDGTVLVEDFGTMSCGTGCVGEFEFELEAGTTGPVLLTVYETSAKDGSPQHVVEVPLTIG